MPSQLNTPNAGLIRKELIEAQLPVLEVIIGANDVVTASFTRALNPTESQLSDRILLTTPRLEPQWDVLFRTLNSIQPIRTILFESTNINSQQLYTEFRMPEPIKAILMERWNALSPTLNPGQINAINQAFRSNEIPLRVTLAGLLVRSRDI